MFNLLYEMRTFSTQDVVDMAYKIHLEGDINDIEFIVASCEKSELWVSWNKDYSVDIKVNLSKGTEYGFCRKGFSYSRIIEQDCEKTLKVAYIDGDREIYRFKNEDVLGVEDKRIIWVW